MRSKHIEPCKYRIICDDGLNQVKWLVIREHGVLLDLKVPETLVPPWIQHEIPKQPLV